MGDKETALCASFRPKLTPFKNRGIGKKLDRSHNGLALGSLFILGLRSQRRTAAAREVRVKGR